METKRTREFNVLIGEDNGYWIAQAVEFNLFAQAKDLDTLKEEFRRVVMLHVNHSLKHGKEPFTCLKPAPEAVKQAFDQAKAEVSNFYQPEPETAPAFAKIVRLLGTKFSSMEKCAA